MDNPRRDIPPYTKRRISCQGKRTSLGLQSRGCKNYCDTSLKLEACIGLLLSVVETGESEYGLGHQRDV